MGSINPIIEKLRAIGYDVVMFADDCVLIVESGKSAQALIDATRIFAEYGLEINHDKCNGTHIEGSGFINFLGQKFTPEPLSLAGQIRENLSKLIKSLHFVTLPKHQQLMIFKQCIITACNWGPLLDVCPNKEAYKEIDEKLTETL